MRSTAKNEPPSSVTHTNANGVIEGEMTRRLAWAPIRAVAIISGLFLIRGLAALIVRYCLGLRRLARVHFEQKTLAPYSKNGYNTLNLIDK